jgi:hypothetical protein
VVVLVFQQRQHRTRHRVGLVAVEGQFVDQCWHRGWTTMSKLLSHSTPSSRLLAPFDGRQDLREAVLAHVADRLRAALSAVIGHFLASGTLMNRAGRFTISQPTMYAS